MLTNLPCHFRSQSPSLEAVGLASLLGQPSGTQRISRIEVSGLGLDFQRECRGDSPPASDDEGTAWRGGQPRAEEADGQEDEMTWLDFLVL